MMPLTFLPRTIKMSSLPRRRMWEVSRHLGRVYIKAFLCDGSVHRLQRDVRVMPGNEHHRILR